MWEVLQKKVYKTCMTDLDEPKQQLRMKGAKLDHVIAAAIHQWHHEWAVGSDQ